MAPGKKQKGTQEAGPQLSGVAALKTLFSDWAEEDLQAVLNEVDNDFDAAVARISEGHAQQWSAVSKKPKPKPTQKKTEPEAPKEIKREDSNGSSTRGRGGSSMGRGGSFTGGRGGSNMGRTSSTDRPNGQNRDSYNNFRNVNKPTRIEPTTVLPKTEEVSSHPPHRVGPVVNSWSNPTPPWAQSSNSSSNSNASSESKIPSRSEPSIVTKQETAKPLETVNLPTSSIPQVISEKIVPVQQQQSHTQTHHHVRPIPGFSLEDSAKIQEHFHPTHPVPSHSIAPTPVTTTTTTAIPHSTIPVTSSTTTTPAASSTVNPTTAVAAAAQTAATANTSVVANTAAPASDKTVTKSPIAPQKEATATSPVVLPHNAAVQGLNLRFGSLGFGNDESAQTANSAPAATAQTANGAPAEKKQTETTEQAYGVQADMLSFIQNQQHMGYGMPGMHPLGYGFYDGVEMGLQQRMMYYDPAYQHQQGNFQGKQPYNKGDAAGAQSPTGNQAYPQVQYPFFPYYPMAGQFPYHQQGLGYPGFPTQPQPQPQPGKMNQYGGQKGGNQSHQQQQQQPGGALNQYGGQNPYGHWQPYGGMGMGMGMGMGGFAPEETNDPSAANQNSSPVSNQSDSPSSTPSQSSTTGSTSSPSTAAPSSNQPAAGQQKVIPPPGQQKFGGYGQQQQQQQQQQQGKPVAGMDNSGFKGQPYDRQRQQWNNTAFTPYQSQNYGQQQPQQQQQQQQQQHNPYWRQ